ncbi:hypothetical protein FRB98_000354, partial [Tulasnella sp. 332]
MFAILVPASLSPLIITLAWAQRKAKRMGLLANSGVDEIKRSPVTRVKDFAEDLDVIGLLLLAGGWACVLIPITLAASTPKKFASGNMIAMLVIGPILLATFIFWELKFAKEPVVAWRFLRNRNVIGAALIGLLLGAGVMIHSRGAQGSTAELVINQVLQGMGGGIAAVVVQVAAQGSVPHLDVATVTAIVLLVTELGTSIGNAIAGGVWANEMPGYLEKFLPATVNATERATIFGSITVITAYPIDDPIRTGAIDAYEAVMRHLTIAATCIAVVPLLLAIFVMKDFRLTDRQNAADDSPLD